MRPGSRIARLDCGRRYLLPRGTSPDIVTKLNSATVAGLGDANLRATARQHGQEIFPLDRRHPKRSALISVAEIAKWWPIIKVGRQT